MKQLLWINLFLLPIHLYTLESQFYSDQYVDITYFNNKESVVRALSKDISNISNYFYNIYTYKPIEPLSITILDSVWDFTSTFSVDSQVGAVWVDGISFLQPIEVLKRKNRYIKTLFTEYSHHFITHYTGNNCPEWLKEGISYYLWLQFSGEQVIEGEIIDDLNFLESFSQHMNNKKKLKDFYYNFILYVNSKIDNPEDIFTLLDNFKESESCFIVTDLVSDEIIYMDNLNYAQRSLFPGSLLKPFTILSLDRADSSQSFICTGWDDLESRCWSRESHGELSITTALAYSCNSFFIQYLKSRLHIDDYYKTLSRYLQFYGSLSFNNYIEQSIGLGHEIVSTPINVLMAYNKLYREEPKHFEYIRQGMKETIIYGTGKKFGELTNEYDIAGKTGTSYRILKNGDIDLNSNTGWFLFLYPADKPLYSFLKVIDASKSELSVKEAAKDFLRWLDESR